MKLYPIFSRRVCYTLEKMGFKVVKMAPNRHNPELNVYYFEDTVKFHDALQKAIQKTN